MALSEWTRVRPLVDKDAVDIFEANYALSLPEDFKKCIVENNAGRPRPNAILIENGNEFDVKLLLSYNKNDIENIYKVIDYFINNYNGDLIPFASDSAGNYYCFKNQKVVLFTQENDIFFVCDSFSNFTEKLYESK